MISICFLESSVVVSLEINKVNMASQVITPFLRAPVLALLMTAAIAIGIWIRRDRRLDKMPGPKGWPLFGIGLGLPKQSAFMHKWGLEYGEVFKLRVGWYNWVVLNSPEAMKEIMDKQVCICSRYLPIPSMLKLTRYSQFIPLPRSLHLWLTMSSLGVYASLPCDMVLNGGLIVMSRTRFSLRR